MKDLTYKNVRNAFILNFFTFNFQHSTFNFVPMPHSLTEFIAEKTFSVTEYLDLVNELLGPLKVSVEGEITDLKILPQWVFFSLKDAECGSLLRCGLHTGVYRKLGVNIEEGMQVKVNGYGKLAPKTGNFGFWVSTIEPIGAGALKRAYELLLKKLDEEGLFARKRALPEFISHIGVISSRNGVVLQDLRNNLLPLGIRIDFVHAGVEGAGSATEILRGIEHFKNTKDKPDVLVLIRGGGSLESLQGFNNEAVVRALFASPIPVLVGIGHDVDVPITTFVADVSVSTPTAVAHIINKSWAPLTEDVPKFMRSITNHFLQRVTAVEHKAEMALQGMRLAVARLLGRFAQYEEMLARGRQNILSALKNIQIEIDIKIKQVYTVYSHNLQTLKRSVDDCERLLVVADPERVLARGYGLVYSSKGTLVRSVDDVTIGEKVTTRLSDGTFSSEVTKKKY